MLYTKLLPLLISATYGRPTRTDKDFHSRPDRYSPSSATSAGYPAQIKSTLPSKNGASDTTHGNSLGVSWLPSSEKVRGVNLGSLFIIEKWMAFDEFEGMGCGQQNDEWECVKHLGQEEADAVFAKHWDTWYTQEDIANISAMGLNVIRVPVGFWLKEDLVQEGEYYPKGGLPYLDRLVGWAADAGLYVIMDLHGAPGVQYPNQQFTGRGMETPGFYTAENYERAAVWLEWMTQRIHSNNNYRTTGVLQVMNEPVHADNKYSSEAADMVVNFYPLAYDRIRSTEKALGVSRKNELRIQYMGTAWGAGDPTEFLPANARKLLFDDHRYYKWDSNVPASKDSYINAVCYDNRGSSDVIMGEWSLSVKDDVADGPEFAIDNDLEYIEEQKQWYRSFWAVQVQAFERSGGWIFWTYKCNWVGGKDEWRWCYQNAVAAGVIPDDVNAAVSLSPCS